MGATPIMVNGWSFERADDGGVSVATADHDAIRFTEEEWTAVVAGVSLAGPENARAARLLHRSSISGQFVTSEEAKAHPDTTVTERD